MINGIPCSYLVFSLSRSFGYSQQNLNSVFLLTGSFTYCWSRRMHAYLFLSNYCVGYWYWYTSQVPNIWCAVWYQSYNVLILPIQILPLFGLKLCWEGGAPCWNHFQSEMLVTVCTWGDSRSTLAWLWRVLQIRSFFLICFVILWSSAISVTSCFIVLGSSTISVTLLM